MAQKAVVIGAGIGGLASAALLAKDGYDVTLLEANDQVGGRAGNWEKDGFRFDTGPSWYLMPEVFDHFYKLMGTSAAEHLELGLLDPGYRVFFEEGKGAAAPIDISAHREKNLELFEQIEPGSREAMEKYLDSAKETYRIAKDYFLYTSFQDLRPLLVGEVLKRVGTLYNLLTKPIWGFASKYVKSHRLRQLLGYPAVFLGSSPYIAPAMFHLMSYLDMEDGVLYAQGGFHRVMESMRDIGIEHGVDLRLNARVTEIVTTKRGSAKPTVSGVRYRDAAGETHSVDADIVVSAADLHHSETTFLPPELQTYPEAYWQKKTPGPSAVLMYLGLKGEVPELLHHSLFFTQDWDDNFGRIFSKNPTVPNPASLYVCKPSATDPNVAPKGDTNIFVLVPMPADVSLGRGGIDGDGDPEVEAIADRAIEQISTWSGISDFAERIVVRRTVGPADFKSHLNAWMGSALGPAHSLAQSALFRSGNVSKKVDGLYYAGSSTIPGIGLPMCLISAEVMLKRLRGDTSVSPLPEPLVATTK